MAQKIGITGELESKTTEGKLADTSQIMDATRDNASQTEINDAFDSAIQDNAADIQRLYRGTGIEEYSQFSDGNAYPAGTIVLYDGVPYKFIVDHVKNTAWDWNEVEPWSEKKEREATVAELNKDIYDIGHLYKHLAYKRLSAASVDSDSSIIISNPNNDIFYYEVAKGDDILVTATNDVEKSFRIGFATQVPAVGTSVELKYDSRPTLVSERYISEIDGYLIVNHTASYFTDTVVACGKKVTETVEENELAITELEKTVGRQMQGTTKNDLDIADEHGNILVSFGNGHIKTKRFDSRTIGSSLLPFSAEQGVAIVVDGSIITSDANSLVNTYAFDTTKRYRIDGYCPERSKALLLAAYYDSNGLFISGEMPNRGSKNDSSTGGAMAVYAYPLTIPSGTHAIKVYGQDDYMPTMHIEDATIEDVRQYNLDRCPQIINVPLQKKSNTDTLRILCFGSSWFMNTWWYLNKIIKSAGIDAELYCFYVGGTQFAEWIDKYKNDASALCYQSSNGSDWTSSNLGFKSVLSMGDWDIIAFQQGARQSIYWDLYWEPYWSDLVSIVKRHCNINTSIVFNSTWTPGIYEAGMSRPDEYWPSSNTVEGQMAWQEKNYRNTQRLSLISGIQNIVPNGATMWALRRDSELNVSKDLASDGLHPDNGLPLYATGGTFFQSVIAPMYGIDFDTVEWLPDSSTQKASVSGNYFQPISTNQRDKIRQIIKLAISDRFGFRTLNDM